MLRVHLMQLWFNLSDPAMEESLYDITPMRQFAGPSLTHGGLSDETTILNFRHLLERNNLAQRIFAEVNATLGEYGLLLRHGTIVDATIIAAPSATKNSTGTRDPVMHQTKKGNQWHFGMKAHIGVDAESGLVHTVMGTAANVNDVTETRALLHGEETAVFADSGYTGVAKREENQDTVVDWYVAAKPSVVTCMHAALEKTAARIEHLKPSIRSKVEHPFRVIKCQFGFTKVRYRALAKNTAQLQMLFALSNLWMAGGTFMKTMG